MFGRSEDLFQGFTVKQCLLKNIGNLRHFYFLQDHTTTDQQNGEQRQN